MNNRLESTFPRTCALLCAVLLVISPAHAQTENDPPLNLAQNLERIVEAGQGHELTLRMVKFGLGLEPRKLDRERDARFVCSHSPPAGSHLNHLTCNRNEIMNFLEEAGVLGSDMESGPGAAIFPFRMAGNEYTTRNPVNPEVLEEAMKALGPRQYNRALINAVFQSKPLPDNSPSVEELDQFASALVSVREVRAEYAPRIKAADGEKREALLAQSDDKMVQAIQGTGLSIERYNRISELVGQYASLRDYVAEHM